MTRYYCELSLDQYSTLTLDGYDELKLCRILPAGVFLGEGNAKAVLGVADTTAQLMINPKTIVSTADSNELYIEVIDDRQM